MFMDMVINIFFEIPCYRDDHQPDAQANSCLTMGTPFDQCHQGNVLTKCFLQSAIYIKSEIGCFPRFLDGMETKISHC